MTTTHFDCGSRHLSCQLSSWPIDVDAAAALYDDIIHRILDDILLTRVVIRRPRPSDPWFDADCRAAKRLPAVWNVLLGQPPDVLPWLLAVTLPRRRLYRPSQLERHGCLNAYRQLRNQKCLSIWSDKISATTNPRDSGRLLTVYSAVVNVPVTVSVPVNFLASSRTRLNGFGPLLLDRHRRRTVLLRLLRHSPSDRVHSVDDRVPTTSPLPYSPPTGQDFCPRSHASPGAQVSCRSSCSILTHLFNRSLSTGCVPAGFKDSFVTPVIKKPGLDEDILSSYRPISNLSVISKLLERLVVRQFVTYLDTHRLLSATQSGFRRGHSTETIRVLSDLLDAVDRGDTAAPVLIDLSAAFDTVDHEILLERLRITFGVDSCALSWFRSYLAGRKQHVRCGGNSSPTYGTSSVVYHRDRSLVRSYSSSTRLIWQ